MLTFSMTITSLPFREALPSHAKYSRHPTSLAAQFRNVGAVKSVGSKLGLKNFSRTCLSIGLLENSRYNGPRPSQVTFTIQSWSAEQSTLSSYSRIGSAIRPVSGTAVQVHALSWPSKEQNVAGLVNSPPKRCSKPPKRQQ